MVVVNLRDCACAAKDAMSALRIGATDLEPTLTLTLHFHGAALELQSIKYLLKILSVIMAAETKSTLAVLVVPPQHSGGSERDGENKRTYSKTLRIRT